MRCRLPTLFVAGVICLVGAQARAEPEIVIAIRYLQAEGTSHSHLYLYREDGKLLRQLTKDNSGQDADPILTSDGETIVFTRERSDNTREFWSIDRRGTGLKKLDVPREWYAATKSSPYFTNREEEKSEASGSASPSASPQESASPSVTMAPTYKSPDGSVELVLQTLQSDEDQQYNSPGHGKHFLIRDLKSGREIEMGKLPGFSGLYDLLDISDDPNRHFLFEGTLRVAFFDLHLNSTDGDTSYALDLNDWRLVNLSPNWAAPIPLPGEPAFLTLTENRYVQIPGSSKTANCSYIERWDEKLNKIRYARAKSAAICYGASMYRPGRTPLVITIRKTAD